MKEKIIEKEFKNAAKSMGGIALKLISPGFNGMPDRLVLLPRGKIAFIELKAPGKKLRPIQEKRKRQIEALGFMVFLIDNIDQIGGILSEIQTS